MYHIQESSADVVC